MRHDLGFIIDQKLFNVINVQHCFLLFKIIIDLKFMNVL